MERTCVRIQGLVRLSQTVDHATSRRLGKVLVSAVSILHQKSLYSYEPRILNIRLAH